MNAEVMMETWWWLKRNSISMTVSTDSLTQLAESKANGSILHFLCPINSAVLLHKIPDIAVQNQTYYWV